jgi:hypothetical protein
MSIPELKQLLDQVADTRELVLRRAHTWSADFDAWSDARDESFAAYGEWRALRTRESYVAYRAAQDREDAAQDTLAQTQMSRSTVS